jgi:FkbM family methyltransferase
MGLLKTFRRNYQINKLVAGLLRTSNHFSIKLHSFFINKWRTAGIIKCRFGEFDFLYFNNCDDGLPEYFYYGFPYHEKANLNLFIELAKNSKSIIDIGANTGLFSILGSKANPESKIIAVEPYSVNSERMKVNLRLNNISNVEIQENALGNKGGMLELSVPIDMSVTDVSSASQDFVKQTYPDVKWTTKKVPVVTLDELAESKNFRADLIKCDVETFEMSVFGGMSKVLKNDRPTIIFECFFDNERKEFFNQLLSDNDYYLYLILETGVVFCKEGLVDFAGSNYLITPKPPKTTFISYDQKTDLLDNLILKKS